MLPSLTVCLDAIDASREKTALLAACVERNIPIVTCGGAAGKVDPTKIKCEDLTRVQGDKLLGNCRTNLRKYHGFAKGERDKKRKAKEWGIGAVYSLEATASLPAGEDKVSALRRCDGALGTACFTTGTFGFVLAARVVDMIASSSLARPSKGF